MSQTQRDLLVGTIFLLGFVGFVAVVNVVEGPFKFHAQSGLNIDVIRSGAIEVGHIPELDAHCAKRGIGGAKDCKVIIWAQASDYFPTPYRQPGTNPVAIYRRDAARKSYTLEFCEFGCVRELAQVRSMEGRTR